MPQQFDNPANVEVHRSTTAQEILRDFADQPLDVNDHRSWDWRPHHRLRQVLKKEWPGLKVFAVEPAAFCDP